MGKATGSVMSLIRAWPAWQALRHRDFRVLWIGTFVSFTGTAIQGVAQQYLVFQLTNDAAKLALVQFVFSLPMSVLSPFVGFVADLWDKRATLVACMVVSGIGPIVLAVLYANGRLTYESILVVAAVVGLSTTIEVPIRQSIVRQVVEPSELAAAIPAQAMTFNLARVVGPAIGGAMAVRFGPHACYLVNGVSFLALAVSALKIRADLKPEKQPLGSVRDLISEGMRFTMRDPGLRTLFLMECCTSICGAFYLSLMAAISSRMLGLDQRGLGWAMSCIGIGAIIGLLALTTVSRRPYKARIVGLSMVSFAIGMLVLSQARSLWIAGPAFALMGASMIAQFNTTNTLFQLLAPERIRGRVLSMHIWAIGGISPIGILIFGWMAEQAGLRFTLVAASVAMMVGATVAFMNRAKIVEPKFA